MIQHIDFSPGQIKILTKVSQIYSENLGEVYQNLRLFGPRFEEEQLLDSLNLKMDMVLKSMEDDFVKFSSIVSNPQGVIQLNRLEIIIIGFIIREWQEEEGWHDLEVMNLLNKLSILYELQYNTNQTTMS